MKNKKKIPEAVIRRLPRYYRYLEDLMNMGISRISSKDLSIRTGLTSSQVRQDFYCFGGFGLQGYGYDVEYLHSEIKKILGLDTMYNMVIIGAGNLGQALAKHIPTQRRGFVVVGVFDNNPTLAGEKIDNIEIMHIDRLEEFVRENPVDIAAITVPAINAREVVEIVAAQRIKGVLNFAPVELKEIPDVVIENIHMSDSLMVLGYKINRNL